MSELKKEIKQAATELAEQAITITRKYSVVANEIDFERTLCAARKIAYRWRSERSQPNEARGVGRAGKENER